MNYLSPEQILFIHARLIEETGGSHGVRDLGGLQSALARPQTSFDAQDLYPDVFHKVADLMDSLIRNHPFLDGNKRTGVATAGIFLRRNGYQLTASNASMVTMVMQIAQSQTDIAKIAAWLQEHTKPISK